MRKDYDVIVVGAGPAGCSAATCLALHGYEVLLVDKAKFPRDKVCGDGISPPALEVLERLGVGPKIQDCNPWKVEGIEVYSPAGHSVQAPFSHLDGLYRHGWVIPRKEFDSLLWQHAQEFSNLRSLEDCAMLNFVPAPNLRRGIRVKWGHSMEVFTGKVIIGADGVYSRIARSIFPPGKIICPSAFAVRSYFHGVKDLSHFIEIHCDRSILPGYGWVFPTGEDKANVGVEISCRFLKKTDLRELFRRFIEENQFVRERLRQARPVEKSFKGWPIPMATFWTKRSLENVLLIGDAGGFADFLTGEGIYFALRSGELAAEAIHKGLNGPDGIEGVSRIYERLCRRIFHHKEYLIRSVLQKLIITEFFLNFNVHRATRNPSMARNLASILCHQKSKIRLLF